MFIVVAAVVVFVVVLVVLAVVFVVLSVGMIHPVFFLLTLERRRRGELKQVSILFCRVGFHVFFFPRKSQVVFVLFSLFSPTKESI